MWQVLKMVLNSTTIGTQTMVIHITESAVTFLSIPYGIRNMSVLVIGRTELIIITANHQEVLFQVQRMGQIQEQ